MDLTTEWLGLTLSNPFVPSSSPLSKSLDSAKALEDAGAAALVMHSLYEEVVSAFDAEMAEFLHQQDSGHSEAQGYLPQPAQFPSELDRYLEQLAALKSHLGIPIIASLNGVTPGGWIKHARELAEAGADALELNIYHIAADMQESGNQVERRYIEVLQQLAAEIQLPINMKLGPFFSSPAHLAASLEQAGASGISLFNRFYQPDIDIQTLRLAPGLHLSSPQEALLAMRWIGILYGRTGLSLSATGGIHRAEDAIKLLLAGADVVHLCSTLLEHGPQQIGLIQRGLLEWMEAKGFDSLADVRGRVSQLTVSDPSEFARANYIKVLNSYKPLTS
ncbi:MAG: dihydroorotate dehydrogenase-like protein [Gammaproteobacteria bacterium SHHR-1]|uniref:dihydroorotate dehydrogenase-like protein n=1 Tax=Magnetovirga frankeli TaxID=947516 RepID=UPI001293D7DC|nr:dihydroorotate dehydrogenase-like protein [gamma proteobacterium SS-5]